MAAMTFPEFEARAGELLGRGAFGTNSGRELVRHVRLLRYATDGVLACVLFHRADQPGASDLATQLGEALGAALLSIGAIAHEMGLSLDDAVAAEIRRRATRAGDTAVAAQLAAQQRQETAATARLEA